MSEVNKCKCGKKLPNVKANETPYEFCSEKCKKGLTMSDLELMKRVIAIFPMASKDETRWHLNGVVMSGHKGKVKLQATDGHRLIIEEYDSELAKVLEDRSFIFRKEQLPVLKMWIKEWAFADIHFTDPVIIGNCKLTLTIRDSNLQIESIENYPDTTRLIPKGYGTVSVAFNAKYLFEMAKALKEIKTHHVTLKFVADKEGILDPRSPILVSCPSNDATAVLMPCRL